MVSVVFWSGIHTSFRSCRSLGAHLNAYTGPTGFAEE